MVTQRDVERAREFFHHRLGWESESERLAALLNSVRLEEAKLIRVNWNVAEEIRSFNHWIDNHIAELERAAKEKP